MKSRAIVLGVLGTIVLLLVWNLLLFAPKGRTLSHAKDDTQTAEQLGSTLQATLTHLQDISRNGPEIAAELDKLSAAVPASPDLDGFILSANQIAVTSGIDWLSVSPAVAQSGTTSDVSVIPLSVQIKGGFFQVLDYLNRLEDMGRLVVVDGINISAAASAGASSGAPILSVTLTARMFTRAAPAAPAGTPTPGATSSPSTPPASGNSSGETSTTAQVQ
jgi:Tfp pilus assembly protein PilO